MDELPSSAPKLPPELFQFVISSLDFNDVEAGDRDALLTCNLVCQVFRWSSIPVIWKEVGLWSPERTLELGQILQTSPLIASAIQSLELSNVVLCTGQAREDDEEGDGRWNEGLKEAMLAIIPTLKGIQLLHFHLRNQTIWSDIDSDIMASLYTHTFPRLCTLSLLRLSLVPLVDIMAACSRLTRLTLATWSTDQPGSDAVEMRELPHRLPLKTLTLRYWDESDFVSSLALMMVLPRVKLEALEIRHHPFTGFTLQSFEPALVGQFYTLRHIYIGVDAFDYIASSPDSLQDMRGLELARYSSLQVLHFGIRRCHDSRSAVFCTWLAGQVAQLEHFHPLRCLALDVSNSHDPVEGSDPANLAQRWQALETALRAIKHLQRLVVRLPAEDEYVEEQIKCLENGMPLFHEKGVLRIVKDWEAPEDFPNSHLDGLQFL